jgi:hypothetical protein
MVTERSKRTPVRRHGMVGEEAGDDLPQPRPLFRDWLMPPLAQFLLDLPDFGSHAVALRLPFDQELAAARGART